MKRVYAKGIQKRKEKGPNKTHTPRNQNKKTSIHKVGDEWSRLIVCHDLFSLDAPSLARPRLTPGSIVWGLVVFGLLGLPLAHQLGMQSKRLRSLESGSRPGFVYAVAPDMLDIIVLSSLRETFAIGTKVTDDKFATMSK